MTKSLPSITDIKAWCKEKEHHLIRDWKVIDNGSYTLYYRAKRTNILTQVESSGVILKTICAALMEKDKFQWPVDRRKDWEKTRDNCS